MRQIKNEAALRIGKLMLVVVAATLCGQAAVAQTVNADSGQGAAPNAQVNPKAGVEILSPMLGVDFTPYMRRLHNDIQRNWTPLIPAEVQAPQFKKGITGIRFTILPDGRIGAMTLETRSGDVALDKAAWGAITGEGNFPPLPAEFHGPSIELRTGFFYNVPAPSTPTVAKTADAPN